MDVQAHFQLPDYEKVGEEVGQTLSGQNTEPEEPVPAQRTKEKRKSIEIESRTSLLERLKRKSFEGDGKAPLIERLKKDGAATEKPGSKVSHDKIKLILW